MDATFNTSAATGQGTPGGPIKITYEDLKELLHRLNIHYSSPKYLWVLRKVFQYVISMPKATYVGGSSWMHLARDISGRHKDKRFKVTRRFVANAFRRFKADGILLQVVVRDKKRPQYIVVVDGEGDSGVQWEVVHPVFDLFISILQNRITPNEHHNNTIITPNEHHNNTNPYTVNRKPVCNLSFRDEKIKIQLIEDKFKSVEFKGKIIHPYRDITEQEHDVWLPIQRLISQVEISCGMTPRGSYSNGVVLNMLDALSHLDITEQELQIGLKAFFKSDKYLELEKPSEALSYFAKGIIDWVVKGTPTGGGANRKDIIYYTIQGQHVTSRSLLPSGEEVQTRYTKDEWDTFVSDIGCVKKIWQVDEDGNPIMPKFIQEEI
jgi:hypothetical protein